MVLEFDTPLAKRGTATRRRGVYTRLERAARRRWIRRRICRRLRTVCAFLIRNARHRRLLGLILALLLVTVQQAAFAHVLSHVSSPASQKSTRTDLPHPAGKVCIECIAFAQLDTAPGDASAQTDPPAAPYVFIADSHGAVEPAFVAHFHSRAPPIRF